MKNREEIEKEFVEINQMVTRDEGIKVNFKVDILLEVLLDIRDELVKLNEVENIGVPHE